MVTFDKHEILKKTKRLRKRSNKKNKKAGKQKLNTNKNNGSCK